MRQILTVLFFILGIVSIVVFAFSYNQVNQEEKRLHSDIQYRSLLIAESLRESIEPNFSTTSDDYLQRIIDKFTDNERFAGLAIYDNKESVVAASETLPYESSEFNNIAITVMDADKGTGGFIKIHNKKLYAFAIPLRSEQSVVGALMIVQNADYIDARLNEIWKNNMVRLSIQVFLLSVAILLVIRWLLYEPIKSLVASLQQARLTEEDPHLPRQSSLFSPLIKEVYTMQKNLKEARIMASEEARLWLDKADSAWTAQRLQEYIKESLRGRSIVVVSNREPHIHESDGKKIRSYVPASGMVTALEPVMEACGGTWIAWGSGDADKLVVNEKDTVRVPPDNPKYDLRRVWLSKEQEEKYYDGFCNDALWPLCHNSHTRPTFRKAEWEMYKEVNGKFAHTVLSQIKDLHKPIILVQDFHFALLPRMIKQSRPDATIGLFWHIPWPNTESFSICPWKQEILDGMLGADLLGFHTQLYCNNFIETVSRELESLLDYEHFTITRGGHTSSIRAFPISIAFSNGEKNYFEKAENEKDQQLLKSLGITSEYVGIGVDRMDYTKGIIERLKGIEIFLTTNPSYKKKFTFIQIAAPSRTKVQKYKEYAQIVEKEVERVNNLFQQKGWKPILLLKKHHTHEEIRRLYRVSNVCMVTSVHDGMNLVAKEYVAARSDEKGALILSQFTGASKELKEALIVNPYNGVQTAEALKTALELSPSEQIKRMRAMRESIKNHNIFRWSADLLRAIANIT